MTSEEPQLSSPSSFSLAELIGLVAGFALAFSCWSSHPDPTLVSVLGSAPGMVDLIRRGIEIVYLLPVVLTPVVIGQRMRLRDLPRPAEWLLIVIAAYRLDRCLQGRIVPYYWSYFEATYVQGGFGSSVVWWSVSGLATLLLCLGTLATVAMRSRLSPTTATLVISILILLAITGPVSWLGGEIGPWLWALYGGYGHGESAFVHWGIRGLAAIPLDLLFMIPIIAIVRDRKPRAPRRWMEETGIILAILLASTWILDLVVVILIQTFPQYGVEGIMSTLLGTLTTGIGPLVAGLIAAGVVARYGSSWDDMLTPRSFRPALAEMPTPHALTSP